MASNSPRAKEVYEWFDISFDKFGHTSTLQHIEACQTIFSLLPKNLLSAKITQQYYCNTCASFLADCLVEGTCPDCSYKSAKGDHCENCLKNFDATELKNSLCKLLFPSILVGTGENWTLAKTINATQYLNYESEKFSKSRGIGIFGDDAKDTNIPVEVWRYYLITNRPEVSDTKFDWDDLQAKLNKELVRQLGNFINRVLKFIAKPSGQGYGSVIPEALDAESDDLTSSLGAKVVKYVGEYIDAMEKVKLKKGLKIAMSVSTEGNAYLQNSDFWNLYKQDRPRCSVVIKSSAGLVLLLACLLEPFMPSFSTKVLRQLNWSPKVSLCGDRGDIDRARRPWDFLPAGHKIGAPEPLFKELRDEIKVALKERYSESQADRLARAELQRGEQPGRTKASGRRGKSHPSKESVAQ